MANKLYEESSIQAIANAIRERNGKVATYKVSEIANSVSNLPIYRNWQNVTDAIKNFIDNTTYNPNDYTTTQISSYAPAVPLADNYNGKCATIPVQTGTIKTNEYSISVTNGNVDLFNSIPLSCNGYGNFVEGSLVDKGVLYPNYFLRWIKTITTHNTRDIGGWECDGGTIKYGKIYRGGEISSEDREVLVNQCGVKHEINLIGGTSGNSALGSDVSITHSTKYNWYKLTDNNGSVTSWTQQLTGLFNAVKENKPIYAHCQQGADRTGTFIYIIETLLGMSQSDCDKEYELTSFAPNDSTLETKCDRARNGYHTLSDLITDVNAKNGSTFKQKVINWVVNELGFTNDDINNFRRYMIDGNPPDVRADANYTNLVPTSIDSDGSIFNTTGYADDYRLSSNGKPSALVGSTCCGYIPAVKGDVIRFTGVGWNLSDVDASFSSRCYFQELNSSFNVIGANRNDQNTLTKEGDVYIYTVSYNSTEYIRLNGIGNGEDLIVTVNQEIN